MSTTEYRVMKRWAKDWGGHTEPVSFRGITDLEVAQRRLKYIQDLVDNGNRIDACWIETREVSAWTRLDPPGGLLMSDEVTAATRTVVNVQCNGICVMASELVGGMSPTDVAYPHPECELHGDVIAPSDQ